MLLPLFGLAASLFLLTRDQEAPLPPPAVLPPELVPRIAVTKPLEGGGSARYFKADIAEQITEGLANFALEKLDTSALATAGIPGAAASFVYRIIPLTPGMPLGSEQTAQQAVRAMQAEGFIVLTTLATALFYSPGTKLVMVCPQGDRRLASQGSQWAILSEAVGAPKVEEVQPVMAGTVAFDPTLPMDIRMDLAKLFASASASPADFVAAAKALERIEGNETVSDFPLTVKSLRDKATAMALRDQVRRAAHIETPAQVVSSEVGLDAMPVIEQPPIHIEDSHPEHVAQVLGNVMGERRKPRGEPKAKDPSGPGANGATQA